MSKKILSNCKICMKDFKYYPSTTTGIYCSKKCFDEDQKFNECESLKSLKERLIKNSTLNEKNGCLEYNKRLSPKGYGRIGGLGRKIMIASRASWMVNNGEIPNGLLVCHSCDNPKCISISHLFLGTFKDNYDDMIAKGRRGMGTLGKISPLRSLSESKVKEIRIKRLMGCTYKEISLQLNIQKTVVALILRGITYKDIK